MDLFLSVHLQKQYLLITLLINLLLLFKWTLLERSLWSLLRSLLIKALIDNIFVERLGFKAAAICVVHFSFFDDSDPADSSLMNYSTQVINEKQLSHPILLQFSIGYGYLCPVSTTQNIKGCCSLASKITLFEMMKVN